jgi:two-component system cell cycle sensor histidine kinase/response regulator CckA
VGRGRAAGRARRRLPDLALCPDRAHRPLAGIGKWITGPFGRISVRRGSKSRWSDPDGAIRAASPGFARRAAGDEAASMAGLDFTALLRSDDRDRIYFAREGGKGTPQTLVNVPLADPKEAPARARGEAPSLMMLLDSGSASAAGTARRAARRCSSRAARAAPARSRDDRPRRPLPVRQPGVPPRRGGRGKAMPPYPSDLVVRQDKSAMSDAVRRFGQGRR